MPIKESITRNLVGEVSFYVDPPTLRRHIDKPMFKTERNTKSVVSPSKRWDFQNCSNVCNVSEKTSLDTCAKIQKIEIFHQENLLVHT